MTTQILKSYASGNGSISFAWTWKAGQYEGHATPKPVTLDCILENYAVPRGYKILVTCKDHSAPIVFNPVRWLNDEMTEGLLERLHFRIDENGKVFDVYDNEEVFNLSMLAAINFNKKYAQDIKAHTLKTGYKYEGTK